jgi:hypothetical protein
MKQYILIGAVAIIAVVAIWLNFQMYQAIEGANNAVLKASAFENQATIAINAQGQVLQSIITYLNSHPIK